MTSRYIHGLKTKILEHILLKYCGKIYIVFYIFHFQKYTNSYDSFDK